MQINEITGEEQLREFMTTPTAGLREALSRLAGDVMVLGAGGKMGPELVETLLRADEARRRRVFAVSRFSDPSSRARERLEAAGAEVVAGDLTSRQFVRSLPDAPNVVYMAGMKFGTGRDWRQAFHLNCIMPYLVGERFGDSRIVVFSSGNPYPSTEPESGGCREDDELEPQGVYGWSIVAREAAFATTALLNPGQKLCFFRLMYAQHLHYGVLVDLAQMVRSGEPISLAVPAVNLVSQRDAIDVALRALEQCSNPALVLNCAGPAVRVREVVERMGRIMGVEPRFAGPEGAKALLANDELARRLFGPYRDGPGEMIEAAARWVMRGGRTWGKPTMFGRPDRRY